MQLPQEAGSDEIEFLVKFEGDGLPHNYYLDFHNDNGQTEGPIPVSIGNAYEYQLRAIDPDEEDLLNFSFSSSSPFVDLVVDPLSENPSTGFIRFSPQFAPDDDLADVTIDISVSDGRGGRDEQSFILDLVQQDFGDNLAPTILPNDGTPIFAEIEIGQSKTIPIHAVDADGPHSLSYGIQWALSEDQAPLPAGLSLDRFTGVVSWQPQPQHFRTEAEGPYLFEVVVSDGVSRSSKPLYINVVNPSLFNNPPILHPIGDVTLSSSGQLEFEVSAEDPDGDAVSFSVVGINAVADTLGYEGVVRWDASNTRIRYPGMSFDVRVTDAHGHTDKETVFVSSRTNDVPVFITAPGLPTATINDPYAVRIRAIDPFDLDADSSDDAVPDPLPVRIEVAEVRVGSNVHTLADLGLQLNWVDGFVENDGGDMGQYRRTPRS